MNEFHHAAYLIALLIALGGILLLSWRLKLGVVGFRLGRAVLLTVALFLFFDWIGAKRGWFYSDTANHLWVFAPSIPIEEPLLLGFLVLLSIALYQLLNRRR
ncbi:MAG: hypothetical protein ACREP9_21560 [Candidatus Dormibacteraceae bacterium]